MGDLRIIGGSLRRRRIKAPAGPGVRPTSDRVREALFDILGPTLEGTSVLDAFAGSGALGIEALSRGARSVTFVERDREALAVLRRNVAGLDAENRCRIVPGAVEELLRGYLRGSAFDLVLADPPYDEPVREPFLLLLSESAVLSEEGRVVVERDQRAAGVTSGAGPLLFLRTARYGRTCLDFFGRADSGASPGRPGAETGAG